MTKIEKECQGIERWVKRDELGQLTTFHLELLKYNPIKDYHKKNSYIYDSIYYWFCSRNAHYMTKGL
jgi:hypothetical protein